MARTLPRADFVQSSPDGRALYAVYPSGVLPSEVGSVVAQLNALRGVTARAIRGALIPSAPRVTAVELTVSQRADRAYALRLMKRLTNPQLPIAIFELGFGVLVCTCNYISSTIKRLQFVQGFEPDDDEAFRLRFYAALRRLPVVWLYGSEPRPPYAALTDALEAMLVELGARATIIEIMPQRDSRPCTHPK